MPDPARSSDASASAAPAIGSAPRPPPPPAPLGLIAGAGRLPVIVARGMKEAGHPVHCLSLAGQGAPELESLCDSVRPVGALRLRRWSSLLVRRGVTHAAMVGRVDKAALLHSWSAIVKNRPDLSAIWIFLTHRRDMRSHRLLDAVARVMAERGVTLIDSTSHIAEHLAAAGPMTARQPTSAQRGDIEFGWPLLREMLRLDIGQAMTVRLGDVVAVEAVEGTDRMIERTGQLCRDGGWTLLKGARAGHDRRADVPTIGPDTIRNVYAAGGRCIALAAGEVIIIDKAQTLALADQLGVAVFGVAPA